MADINTTLDNFNEALQNIEDATKDLNLKEEFQEFRTIFKEALEEYIGKNVKSLTDSATESFNSVSTAATTTLDSANELINETKEDISKTLDNTNKTIDNTNKTIDNTNETTKYIKNMILPTLICVCLVFIALTVFLAIMAYKKARENKNNKKPEFCLEETTGKEKEEEKGEGEKNNGASGTSLNEQNSKQKEEELIN